MEKKDKKTAERIHRGREREIEKHRKRAEIMEAKITLEKLFTSNYPIKVLLEVDSIATVFKKIYCHILERESKFQKWR